jgi:hypothetical protein
LEAGFQTVEVRSLTEVKRQEEVRTVGDDCLKLNYEPAAVWMLLHKEKRGE